MKLSQSQIAEFRKKIYDYYKQHKRPMPWRNCDNPYYVVISELMLQQTQVPRVLQKFPEFITALPDFSALAQASMKDVITQWQGMGYNRRAKYLKQIAEKVVGEYGGILPSDPSILETFPGIGPATAGSIAAFAYDTPTIFIETNIRRVHLHFFFPDRKDVHDKEIKQVVEQTLDTKQPREWYYALMDYGTMMMKSLDNPNKRSKHYSLQSRFEGSDRQIRGRVLKVLVSQQNATKDQFLRLLQDEEERVSQILDKMEQEGMIVWDKIRYRLPD
ncbi:MAG: hypothetical protein RI947_321 [Candidatus Parcubacteria bacterium]